MALAAKWVKSSTIKNLVYTNLTATGCVQYGEFHSTTAGSGFFINSSQTAAVKIYGDVSTENVGASVRGLLSRVLITAHQKSTADTSIHGIQGQIKFYKASGDFGSPGMFGGVWGYVEAGITGMTFGQWTGAIHAQIDLGAYDSALASSSVLAGLYALLKSTGTLTIASGGLLAGVYVGIHPLGTNKWTHGIYVKNTSVKCAMSIGDSANTAGSGVRLGASASGYTTAAVRMHADDGGAALDAGAYRTMVCRSLVTTTNTADVSVYGIQAQVKVLNSANQTQGVIAGLWALTELGTITTGAIVASINACIDVGAITGTIYGVASVIKATSVSAGAYGIFIGKDYGGSTTTWTRAIYISSADAVFGFVSASAYEAGIKIAGSCKITTVSGADVACAGFIRIYVGATVYYVQAFDATQVSGA